VSRLIHTKVGVVLGFWTTVNRCLMHLGAHLKDLPDWMRVAGMADDISDLTVHRCDMG